MNVPGGVRQDAAVTGEGLLGEANRLLAGIAGEPAVWPRACAILIRTALEVALDGYWATTLPDAARSSMRAQLLLLPQTAGRGIAEPAAEAWTGLSRAAHHHSYELSPTAAELRRWHDLVTGVVADLARQAPTR